jgi:hypothetical protein
MKWQIECSFTVYYTLTVEGDSFESAQEKLCGKQIFTEQGDGLFGLCPDTVGAHGVEVLGLDYDGDPSPTGDLRHPSRCWDYHSVCGGCGRELTYDEEQAGKAACGECVAGAAGAEAGGGA